MLLQQPLYLFPILSLALAAPSPTDNRRAAKERRQGFSDLVVLASEAGIALPTDPAVLLSLGPVAAQLASVLPTQPVLSVLETAAPSGFLSNIVHDPAFASSFEQAFSEASSPSWFNALPTDVKSYLHTYSGYGGVATAVGQANSIETAAAGSGVATATAIVTDGLSTVGTVTGTGATNGTETMTGTASDSTASTMMTTTASSGQTTGGGLVAGPQSASTAAAGGSSSAGASTATSTGGAAPRQTGALIAAGMGALGMLGLAVAL